MRRESACRVTKPLPYTAFDALQWLAHRTRSQIEWATDSIGWSSACDDGAEADYESELDSLSEHLEAMDAVLAGLPGQWGVYSDGRPVSTSVEIERGAILDYLWSPDPSVDVPHVISGHRPADPGVDGGTYQVTVTPPSSLTVQLFPPATD
ncbi:hypothetical protein ACQPXH_19105 [Nocardia sp. CA-135953]|uniref:hypothetical protein n=1 Tax=Nocardia sp. CA-135953 TaxID=3239978 RepID=UPI003D9833E7